MLGDPSKELDFTKAVLSEDAKNYHTWAYRQWVLSHFGGLDVTPITSNVPGAGSSPELWQGENEFTKTLLEQDIRNNSAFNHRWYCLFGRRMHGRDQLPAEVESVRDAEIRFVDRTASF